MVVVDGVDWEDAIIIHYPSTQRVGVLTASLRCEGKHEFLRVEGSKGSIVISGPGCSLPRKVRIEVQGEEVREVGYDHEGIGFYFEADAVAGDVIGGERKILLCLCRNL